METHEPESMNGQKTLGQYFTPEPVARSLVAWAKRSQKDRMLDPSCGDGIFLALHKRSVGVEQDHRIYSRAVANAPWALVHEGNFFTWANSTVERFDFATGNPPFIRYQHFSGRTRQTALDLCRTLGASFSGLTSSWAPFLVVTANLLKPGGRLAFVVPAEIGHAPYAQPLLTYLKQHFRTVHFVAVKEKLFPKLSEDVWLLYADGYADTQKTCTLKFTVLNTFRPSATPPKSGTKLDFCELEHWRGRLRPFLLPPVLRKLYLSLVQSSETVRLGDIAKVGIGYVTGANDFFHLRPSAVERLKIPWSFLQPTVRAGRFLPSVAVTPKTVANWLDRDEPSLLLKLASTKDLPKSVKRYLNTKGARQAQAAYKCRTRTPWYSVPNVSIPDGFLSYLSSTGPMLVANRADCSCTNSVHAVRLSNGIRFDSVQRVWSHDLVTLSTELEGHPLGGGLLKLEPREASRVLVPMQLKLNSSEHSDLREGVNLLRSWRHSASS
ncbi:MAG: N-6 DNA methylase [Gammaproteobacteria bacterium]|nr:N-6 DNA methylase [Gammaproteobacteria bacterium]MYF02045.1 N-6 DNA methylase [Gammaproteobacteria bacterium]MYI76572.1 N-6 DNA methylase [Gammaproteobacteria bacterium]